MRAALLLTLAILYPAAPAMAQQSCLNTADLLAWWRADGSTADATGVRHGTFVGTERYEAGPSGRAFSFDGASYVAVPHDAAFTGNSGVTVAAWIKRGPQFGYYGPIAKMPGVDDASGFSLEMLGETVIFGAAVEENEFHGGGWGIVNGPVVPANVWSHVAGSYDGAYLRIYLNGQLVASEHLPGRMRPAAGPLHIGHDPYNDYRFVTGPIDDVVVFGSALYDDDVRLLYEGGLAACPLDARERPIITWNPAGGLTNMTPLDAANLNASASVPGHFEYSPAAGTLLPEGVTSLLATFIPDDQVRYQVTRVYRQVRVLWQNVVSERSMPFIVGAVGDVGGSDRDVVVDVARNRVWILNPGLNALMVLDGRTGDEVASIPVSSPLSGYLAIDAARGHVYAGGVDSVRVFDTQTHAEINSFYAGQGISALFVDEAGAALYVGLRNAARVDRYTLPIASQTPSPASSWNTGGASVIAEDPIRKLLYVLGGLSHLFVIDLDFAAPTFLSVVADAPAGSTRPAIAVNPRTGLVYVSEVWSRDGAGVRVFDGRRDSPAFGTFLTAFRLPEDLSGTRGVTGLAVNPVTNVVYAQTADVRGFGSYIMVELWGLDGSSGEVLSEIWLEPYQLDLRRNFDGGKIAINPGINRIYVVGDRVISVVEDRPAATLPIGEDAMASPVTVATPAAQVTFADVVLGGTLNVQAIDVSVAGIPAAGQFKLTEAIGFEISTTATVTAPFTVCLNASHVTDPSAFAGLSLLHAETVNGVYQWVDRTVSRDFNTGMVCGETMSLSPFAVAQRIGPRYSLKTMFDTRARQVGSVIPVRVRAMQDGIDVSSAGLLVTAVDVVNVQTGMASPVADAGNANRAGAFRFDDSAGGYIFNLSTRSLAPGTYALRVRIGAEPATHDIRFDVR